MVQASKAGFEAAGNNTEVGAATHVKLTLLPEIVHSSVEVHDTAPPIEEASSGTTPLRTSEVKNLPSRPATVADSLPLIPGVVESPQGEITMAGAGEQHGALVVNQTDVTDPATGKFGQTIPVDAVDSVDVLSTPFLAEYGGFTSGVVAVHTRRGGDKWHAELNDPMPGFRFRSWHLVGLRDTTPRVVFSGPLIADRLFFITNFQYSLVKKPERTLGYPFNESKQELKNSFSELDYIISSRQMLTATLQLAPQHTNFINPNYFNPQPVTPSYREASYVATITDHLGIGNGTLDSIVSAQRFDASIGAQGTSDMILTPEGNSGNYFGSQNRETGRTEVLETWTPKDFQRGGRHQLEFGSSFSLLTNSGLSEARPIDLLDSSGILLQRITFTPGTPYSRQDAETTFFAQDHWNVNPRLAFDLGARFEYQSAASSSRVAPRAGLAWTPFSGGRTTLRGGYGEFYDRVPLGVFTFSHYPERIVTDYAPDGSILGPPVLYQNVIGSGLRPHFTPRSDTWNAQLEQRLATWFRVRALYAATRSAGLVVLEPLFVNSINALQGAGRAIYRRAELTARAEWKSGQFLVFAYTRSRAQGNLNDFSNFTGNFPVPLIRPNIYSNLDGDVPNRFIAWGRVNLPKGLEFLPFAEYRTGFPYARVDALGNYVGTPNSNQTRFPGYFDADARILRDFRVKDKYTLRFSASGFNLTNHFNPLAVHANIADPFYGTFFGHYHLLYRADFDVLF